MSEEHPERIYGRLQEALHISGYTFEHLCNELKTLLSTDQWRTIGPGYTDFSKFIRTIDLSAFNFDRDERKELIEMMSKAGASNRAIADAVGVASTTIDRNIAANAAPASENTEETSENGAANAAEENESASVPNGQHRKRKHSMKSMTTLGGLNGVGIQLLAVCTTATTATRVILPTAFTRRSLIQHFIQNV